MTREAAERLIEERQGQLCALLYRRADGTVLTSDCPVGVRAHAARIVRRVAASLAGVLPEFKARVRQCQTPARPAARALRSSPPLTEEQIEQLKQLGSLSYVEDAKPQ
jgi:hypothetical protein